MLTAEASAMIPTVHAKLTSVMNALAQIDMEPAFRLDAKLKSDPAALEEFKNDPEGVAKREGVIVPEGFHFHFIDANNEYFPKEGDPISQLQKGNQVPVWGRVEIRCAVGPGCTAFCGACT